MHWGVNGNMWGQIEHVTLNVPCWLHVAYTTKGGYDEVQGSSDLVSFHIAFVSCKYSKIKLLNCACTTANIWTCYILNILTHDGLNWLTDEP